MPFLAALRLSTQPPRAALIAYKGDDMATSQNTPVVIGGKVSASIKTANIADLTQFSEAMGCPLSSVLNRAIEQWMKIEAPVYLERATRKA
jgi:hypothetical protein